jgi:hypothetical protein
MSSLSSLISKFDDVINRYSFALSSAEKTNTTKKQLIEQLEQEQEKYNKLSQYNLNVTQLLAIVNRGAIAYRDNRIHELEDRAKLVLDIIYPREQFYVKIQYQDQLHQSDKAEVLVGPKDSDGIFLGASPACANGSFAQQLISNSLITSVMMMLGINTYFLDEAFNSGDDVNVGLLKPFFYNLIENNIQLICIEHKKSLYSGLKHTLIRMTKQMPENKVIVESIEDVDEVDLESDD